MNLQDIIKRQKTAKKEKIEHNPKKKYTVFTGLDLTTGKAFYEPLSMATFRALQRRKLIFLPRFIDKKWSKIEYWRFY
jgi:hypothetical protein